MTTRACKLQSSVEEVVFLSVPDVEPFTRTAKLGIGPFFAKKTYLNSIIKALRMRDHLTVEFCRETSRALEVWEYLEEKL